MKYMDLHIHLQDYPKDIAPEMVKKAINLGFKKFVCVGTSPKDWEKVSDITTQYPDFVTPAFGIHPWQVSSVESDWQQTMEKYLQKFPHSLVGEIGLDNLKPEIELQKQYFSFQVEIAKKYNRPIIIHAVKSFHLFENLWKTLPKKFMFHSFSSSVEQLQKIISHGGYVSFNQSVLKKSNFADIIKAAPENKILLESDGPYQSLNKGEFSTPLYIPELLEKIAFIKNCSQEELSEIIYNNSMEFINVG
ncbi:MAG: TatD family hydrolase [Alphaproteobacteria bacterium]|nr:TatD family hydrolase [Alphaproteobacteria bacterium]